MGTMDVSGDEPGPQVRTSVWDTLFTALTELGGG